MPISPAFLIKDEPGEIHPGFLALAEYLEWRIDNCLRNKRFYIDSDSDWLYDRMTPAQKSDALSYIQSSAAESKTLMPMLSNYMRYLYYKAGWTRVRIRVKADARGLIYLSMSIWADPQLNPITRFFAKWAKNRFMKRYTKYMGVKEEHATR